MNGMDGTGLPHMTFKLLVCRPEVETKDQDSARPRWILILMRVGSLTTTLLALATSKQGLENPASTSLTLALAAPAHGCWIWES